MKEFPWFIPQQTSVTLSEKIISGLAGGLAIFLLGLLLQALPRFDFPLFMLGSIAASAVLLFAVPHSPMAQPWNLIAGHAVSALAGWCYSLIISDPILAAGMAVGTSILLMHLLNCLHPPGAATALLMVLSSTQFHQIGWLGTTLIVFNNVLITLILALLINNFLPHRRYPANQTSTANTVKPGPFITLEQSDLASALRQMNGIIDISEADLATIYQLALEHSQRRIENNQTITP